MREACSLLLAGRGIGAAVSLKESLGEELRVFDERGGGYHHVMMVNNRDRVEESIAELEWFVESIARCQRFFAEKGRWPTAAEVGQ